MRTISRTLPDSALTRDAVAIAAAMIAVGASFGAITISYGLPTWLPFLMSTVVFAGGAQFLAVGLIAAGNPIAAVLAGLLLNGRHLPFGLAVSQTIGPRWRDRLIGSHLMTDEVVAFTLREKDEGRRRRTYWLIGFTLFTSWNAGTALGVWLGGATGDQNAFGLDAAFPAGLIALIMPSLRDRDTRVVALAGAGLAVLMTPVLPAGLPVLCALVGLVALFVPRRGTGSAPRRGGGFAPPGDEASVPRGGGGAVPRDGLVSVPRGGGGVVPQGAEGPVLGNGLVAGGGEGSVPRGGAGFVLRGGGGAVSRRRDGRVPPGARGRASRGEEGDEPPGERSERPESPDDRSGPPC